MTNPDRLIAKLAVIMRPQLPLDQLYVIAARQVFSWNGLKDQKVVLHVNLGKSASTVLPHVTLAVLEHSQARPWV